MPIWMDVLNSVDRIKSEVLTSLTPGMSLRMKIQKAIEIVVPHVEYFKSQYEGLAELTGPEKKEFAIQIIDELYERHIRIKFIPMWIQRIFLRKALSAAIDSFVSLMNEKGIFKHSA